MKYTCKNTLVKKLFQVHHITAKMRGQAYVRTAFVNECMCNTSTYCIISKHTCYTCI